MNDAIPRVNLYFLLFLKKVKAGDSSQPAKRDPIITVEAPAAKALTISPEFLIPPSATIGTSYFFATAAHSEIAVNWGTPAPATILVMHKAPGPIPTLMASAPLLINSS